MSSIQSDKSSTLKINTKEGDYNLFVRVWLCNWSLSVYGHWKRWEHHISTMLWNMAALTEWAQRLTASGSKSRTEYLKAVQSTLFKLTGWEKTYTRLWRLKIAVKGEFCFFTSLISCTMGVEHFTKKHAFQKVTALDFGAISVSRLYNAIIWGVREHRN